MGLTEYKYNVAWDSYRYALANSFLNDLRKALSRGYINYQTFKELRQMALGGDVTGAKRELEAREVRPYDR